MRRPETLLVYFNDRAVETIESTAAATRTAATRSGVASVDDVLSRLEIVSLERLFTYDARNEEQTRAAGLHKWYILTFGQGADLEKAARELAGVAEVSRIQFDTKLQKASVGNPMPFRIDETGRPAPISPAAASMIPDFRTNGTTATTATKCSRLRRPQAPTSMFRRHGN